MEQQPHWLIVVAIGACVGYLLPHALAATRWVFRKFRPHVLEGQWFECHLTFEGDVCALKRENWLVRKGLQSKLVVVAASHPREELKYKGTITERESGMVVTFQASTHHEDLTSHLMRPIPTSHQVLIGFWLGLDFHRRIAVGPQVLSRRLLEDVEARDLLQRAIKADAWSHVMALQP